MQESTDRWVRPDEAVRQLYDHVLIRNVIEYRHALGLMERNGLGRSYIQPLARDLRLMEDELRRRGLEDPVPTTPLQRVRRTPAAQSVVA